ncbi:MAG TPA: hypothetical protein VHA06_06340, partial [Candidatus Angelobacter sp.]|nr:hypothetical protein [Candidatus Angelobacter sp.]
GDASGAVASLLSNIAAGKAVDSVTKGLGKQVSKVAPKTATVAGESTPVMAGQMKDAAPIAKTMAAEPSQAIAEQQQVAGQQGVKNVASEALNRQLEKVGKDAEPVQKQLPASSAPGGKEPFVFTIPGNMPEEVISGKAVVPAKRVYAGTEDVPVEQPAAGDEPNYNRQRQELGTTAETIPDATRGARSGAQVRAQEMGSTGSTVPERVLNGPSTAKQIKWQYLTSGTEEGESTAARGQGTLHTSNPKAATETLEALKNLEDQTPAVKDAISSLEQQLQQYHSYDGKMPPSSAAVPRAGQASSFADAAQQVKAAAQPTFKKLDQLSDGAFSTFQNKLKMATKAERRATNMEDMEAAQQAQTEARKGIDDLMTKHSSQFQPNELANAQSAWRDMQTLDTVHSYVEKAFSAPEDVAGASKTISRNLNGASLKTNLNQMLDQVPRADLERVLGKDGVQNLYEVAELTAKPENLAKMQSQITQLASEGTLTKLVKSPLEARNLVARTLATSPRVSQMMMNALKFGTPAKIYGPLIANAIAQAHVPEPAEDDSKK